MQAAERTATGAIFDLSNSQPAEFVTALREAGARQVKVSADFIFDAAAGRLIQDSGIQTLWVEYHPAACPRHEDAFLERLLELDGVRLCVPISGDLGFLNRLTRLDHPPRAIGLKGSESAGFVSSETASILFATLREWLMNSRRSPDLILWGGIATPQAAAAFLSCGASGIVFESLHWLTDLVQIDQELRQRIARLRPEHTSLVGGSLGAHCRVFDKGNSQAVQDLRRFAATLGGRGNVEADRCVFARRVLESATPALESDFGPQALVPLGPEAAFAEAFCECYGRSSVEAMSGFAAEVERQCRDAPRARERFLNSALAKEWGTQYPFIQGAMSWISDVPAFASAVADAGALPTLSLGIRDRGGLEETLGALPEIMGDRVYAINLMALSENPHRDEQFAWMLEKRPPLAVIAAGDPSHARPLRDKGIQVLYIAPDEGLLRMALEAGVRYVILEGNEAGGHVGAHSTLTLAQIAMDLKRREPQLFERVRVILAGGIFNRHTAFMAAMLGAEGIQMGTVYLATGEIVSTGAVTDLYQRMILEARPAATEVSGEGLGLRVRALKTPKTETIFALEKAFLAGQEDERSFRRRLEEISAGSLLIAARGVRWPGGQRLDEETCLREGQFMSGAAAGAISRIRNLAALHKELAEGSIELSSPFSEPREARGREPWDGRERIAITGMALTNALGDSPLRVLEAALAMRSGIAEVPSSRWDHGAIYDPDPRALEKTYCNVGAFQDLDISRRELGIAPQEFRSMSESTKLTMWLAKQSLSDSGIGESDVPRERIGVVISQNSGESASTLSDLIIGMSARRIVHSMGRGLGMTAEQEWDMEQRIKSGRLRVDDTTLLGRLNCAAGGFICNKYGFAGPSYSVSAACATSLVALYSAIQMIRAGLIDAALVGGGEEPLTPAHYLEFSALGALAGISGARRPPDQASRPFDATRDGMVLGEGGAMIVIERESVARRRGARIHAFITGMGASNNNQGMVESLAETQSIAMRAAFGDTPYGPEHVDLVECHATSTVQGDVEEIKALKAFFSRGKPTVLTSFKSQIGHTLGASGLSSLIRGVCAMQAGQFPGTLNYRTPDPQIGLEDWGFRVLGEPGDWARPLGRPRRMQINAFGFGGANYVVHVEECRDNGATLLISSRGQEPAKVKDGPEDPLCSLGVSVFTGSAEAGPMRLGVLAQDERAARAELGAVHVEPGTDLFSPKTQAILGSHGIFVGRAAEAPGPLAFVFAGQGTHYPGMGQELYQGVPEIRKWMDLIAGVADFDILHLLFHSKEEDLQKTRWQQPALFTLEYAMARCLMGLGVKPVAMAGHSLGELTALCVAGVFSWADGFRIVNKRAQCMDKAAGLGADPGTMIAVNAPMELLRERIAGRPNLFFTNFNSPHQTVMGGGTREVLELKEELEREGHWAAQLRVSMAFHSPIMKVIREELETFVSGIEFHAPRIPVISNTTMHPFPEDPQEIRRILMAHLESPVHWVQNVSSLWNDYGIREFVDLGPKDTLSNLISETFEGACCVQTCRPGEEIRAYRAATAKLYAMGHIKTSFPPPRVVFPHSPVIREPSPSATKPSMDPAWSIVQREINTFVLKTFGERLKPIILEALRRELDPRFSEEHLEDLLRKGLIPTSLEAAGPVAPAAVGPSQPPAAKRVPGPCDYLEEVIRIIMDATGFEREEIEPNMDLRKDLAIRSSRLPVIMNAAEQRFGISVRLEDFIGVRTVSDLAGQLGKVAEGRGARGQTEEVAHESPLAPAKEAPKDALEEEPSRDTAGVRRFIFEEVPFAAEAPRRLKLKPGARVAIVDLSPGTGLAGELAEFVQRDLKSVPIRMEVLGQKARAAGHDLSTPEGADGAASRLCAPEGVAGILLVMEGGAAANSMGEIPALLTGIFRLIKSFMGSPSKAYCALMHRDLLPQAPAAVAAEGIVGMLLAVAQEYTSVLFRSVALERTTPLKAAMERVLDAGTALVQFRFKGEQPFIQRARAQSIAFVDGPPMRIKAGDVLVVSGGGRGITPHLAGALAVFRPRLILLGRTRPGDLAEYDALLAEEPPNDARIRGRVKERNPRIEGDELEAEVVRVRAGLEIARTVRDLAQHGAEVSYEPCDVSDAAMVRSVLDGIVQRYGQIDGILHGAGVIRDAFMAFMAPEDFERVVDVKLLGAWNLFQAARDRGLRFMVGLSSMAAVLGNAGQVNYCGANRAMSAMLSAAGEGPGAPRCKVLILPPVDGAGMADDPEVKALMRLRGMEQAYLHVSELSELFCRELIMGPGEEPWVGFARSLPSVKTVCVELERRETGASAALAAAGVEFKARDLPMIDSVSFLDLKGGVVQASRSFSQEKDLWLEDHRPFKFLESPLVSGVMAVEAFLEAARILHPHLIPLGVRHVRYQEILECPAGRARDARVRCRRISQDLGKVVCQVDLSSRDMSPSGKDLDRWSIKYEGEVILGGPGQRESGWPHRAVTREELDTRPMADEEVLEWYENRTNLQRRYRVMESLDGTGPGMVRGTMRYQEMSDFAGMADAQYHFSPYLLEALFHLASFYPVMRDEEEGRSMIPAGVEEVRFGRRCVAGERITLEARLRGEDAEGHSWDVRAVDASGTTIMQALNLRLKWFQE